MMVKRKKTVIAAICMAVASVGFVAEANASAPPQETQETSAPDLQNFHLAEIVVNGKRYIAGEYVRATSNIGILGEQDAMNSPISVTTISEKAVEDFMSSTEGLSKMLSLVPSVQKTYDAAVDCVNIRGFSESGRGFMVNGIPGMQAMTRQSSNYIDSIDVIEGPATGIRGSSNYTADGGTININSKQALDDPNSSIGLKWHSKGAFEETVDIGRRFGEGNRYGIRINASNVNGERSIKNWDLEQRNIYINLDQKTDDSKTNLMVGYTYTDSQGRPYGLTVASSYIGSALPTAPDGDINFNPVWRCDKNTNFVATLNHEQKINDHLSAFLNAGHFKQDWYYYVGFSKTLLNEAGDFTATADNYSLIEKRDYAQIGLRGDFKTGDLKHNYTLGVDRQWHYYGGPSNSVTESGWNGNIYVGDPGNWSHPTFGQSDARYTTRNRTSGWSVMDIISTDNEKLNILIGLNGKSIKRDSYKADGSHNKNTGHYYDISPAYGISYAFSPRFTVYANHTEEFVEGEIVSTTSSLNYTNKGETLDPYKTKQTEFGIKMKTGDFLHKLSYFDIKKANGIDILNSDGSYTRGQDGERRHKGIEYTATGTIAEKWNLIGGFMHLNTEQKTSSTATNGKRPNGVPDWTASLGVEYEASDAFSALLRGNYVGTSYVLNEKYKVPSYFTMDLGVKYKTKMNSTPVTLNAICYNVFNKNYWSASGNVLHLGGPRTFMVSAEFEL
ncbi:TonB-dependent receptor [Phascolarctobacterium faecium]|uniref:TonB-dependent receptor n=1 Tax=Phascolarctobacterium faecium TaxID=33025 RepID=UPI003A905AA1